MLERFMATRRHVRRVRQPVRETNRTHITTTSLKHCTWMANIYCGVECKVFPMVQRFSSSKPGHRPEKQLMKKRNGPVRNPPTPTQSSRPKPDAQKGRDHHHRGRSQDTRYHSKASGMSLIRQVGVLWLF
jgi:hypothetical protein